MRKDTVITVHGDRLLNTHHTDAVEYSHKNGRARSVPEDAWVLESEIRKALAYDASGEVVLDMGRASSLLKKALSRITLKGVRVHSSLRRR